MLGRALGSSEQTQAARVAVAPRERLEERGDRAVLSPAGVGRKQTRGRAARASERKKSSSNDSGSLMKSPPPIARICPGTQLCFYQDLLNGATCRFLPQMRSV